jgi:hypothetical protein
MGSLLSPPPLLVGIAGDLHPLSLLLGLRRSWDLNYRPPFGGGVASLAIPLTVTREVKGVSSLVAPPLTVVRALPLMVMVNLHPSLLGSSQDVLGGEASPPPAPAEYRTTGLLPPSHLRLRCLCQLLSQLLFVLHPFLSIGSYYPPSILEVITSRLGF